LDLTVVDDVSLRTITKLYYLSKGPKYTWSEANEVCIQNGLKFAAFTQTGEARSVLNLINEFWTLKNIDVKAAIFLNAITRVGGSKKDFLWVNNPGFGIEEDDLWNPNEPNGARNEEFCLGISAQQGLPNRKIGFNDLPCDYGKNYILCEKYLNSQPSVNKYFYNVPQSYQSE
jgi:hypothetical protein